MIPDALARDIESYEACAKIPKRLWKPYCRPGGESRRAANRAMKVWRSVPRAYSAHKVVLTALTIRPELRAKAIKTLPQTGNSLWVRARRLARMLVDQDRSMGGHGWTARIEYRRCRNCHRILIGTEAADYRERMRLPLHKWDTKKGPRCGVGCK